MERIYYDYDTFTRDLKALADKSEGGYDALVAIARGGMTMAHMLGEYWDIRPVFVINAIGYDATEKRDRVHLFNVPDLKGYKKVLIVDDIADSGETLEAVRQTLEEKNPGIRFQSATLFYKPLKSCVEPDFWVRSIGKEWIDFFWSDDLKNL